MWQKEKKDASIVKLVLWVALATTQTAATLVVSAPMLAQSTPKSSSFPLPQTVQNGTTVRIDGSSGLSAINQSLKENFEKQFLDTKIEVAANGTDAALKALLDGKIDIAAIGRGLTPAEKAQGLEQIRLRREKIAIIVGADNPFKQSLTDRQFARIFQGKITDWSQLGGSKGKIRVIDHPKTSDTRNTFRDYPAFKATDFTTGSNATQLTEDNTVEIVKQLGKDGISYVLANQVSKLPSVVRVLQLHQTLPSDPKYPFSQPLIYVYKKNPSSSTVDFLGFTLASPGQQAIERSRTAEAEAIAVRILQPVTTVSPTVQITPDATPSPSATTSVFSEQPFVAPGTQESPILNRETPFWLLLPLFITTVGGSLLWWFLGRRSSPTEKTDNLPESNLHPLNPEDRDMAVYNPNSAALVNEAMLEEKPVSHFQEQETSHNTPFQIYAYDRTNNATTGTLNLGQETPNGISNSFEGTTSGVANGAETHNLGAAALTSGTALTTGIGAATWSAFNNKGTETNVNEETISSSNTTEINPPESDQVAWDIEAPTSVVNTSYPHLANIPEDVTDVELPSSEMTDSLPELPNVTSGTSDFEYWDTEVTEDAIDEELQAEFDWLESITSNEDTASVDELPVPQFGEVATDDVEPSTPPTAPLPELPEEVLNVVADAAEPTVDLLEEESQAEPTVEENVAETDSTNLAAAAALAAGAGIGSQAPTFGSNIEGQTDPTVDNVPMSTMDADEQSNIALTPRTWESADVSWEISETQKAALRQQGGSQLVVRLYDVTGIDLSYQIPQFVQQYECEETAHNRSVAIPVSDRDYIVEIGYIADSDAYGGKLRWLFIARSAMVHVFSPVVQDPAVENFLLPDETDIDLVDVQEESSIVLTPRTPEWADVSWKISETQKSALQPQNRYQLILRLYDVTGIDLSYQSPQLVQQYECEETARDRFVAIPVSDHDYIAEIGYINDGDRWLLLARSLIVRVFSVIDEDAAVENVALTSETANNLVDVEEESSIMLTLRTPKWAYVSWYISNAHKSTLKQQGGSQLVVRLYDVTGIDLSYQSPQLVQQYECEEVAHDCFVAIPMSDHDYMVEIGYIADGERWSMIARSAIVRFFNPVDEDAVVENVALTSEIANNLVDVEEESSIMLTPRTPKWAYVSWYISNAQKSTLKQQGGSQLVVRLYDVTGIDLSYQSPQLVQQYECEEVAHDRFVAIPVSDRDYMVEIGYIAGGEQWLLSARSTNVRVFSHSQGDFWFVADAELIIHGATQPNTNVTIDGYPIKIKPDGTFHLRLPFSDGLMDYLITVAADGESTKTIHKKFSQETSEN